MGILNWRGRTSKKAFTERFSAALRKQLPDATFEELGELEFRFERQPDIGSRTVWLGRAYQEFCKAPAEVEEILSRWLSAVTATHADIDPDFIIPVVKDSRWRADNELTSGDGFDPWTEPYNSELMLAFVQYRDGLWFPHRSDFVGTGIPFEMLRERAFANLRRLVRIQSVRGEGGAYLLGAGGTIDANLLLLEESTRDPRIELVGDPLVAVSDRDSFWIADDANPYAIFDIAARVAHCYRNEAYPISRQLFRRVDAVWQPLDPQRVDESHPVPNLDVIDLYATKKTGGVVFVVMVATPLSTDARSVFRLLSKLDGHLCEIESAAWKQEHPLATTENTEIVVKLHPDSDPVFEGLLASFGDWVRGRGARLVVEEIEPG